MTDEPQVAQTPLIDLLRNTPLDAVATYEHHPTEHSHIPYGYQAHQAADEIDRLNGLLAKLREILETDYEYGATTNQRALQFLKDHSR